MFKYDKRKARSSKGRCSSHFAMLCESMAKFKIIYSTFISIPPQKTRKDCDTVQGLEMAFLKIKYIIMKNHSKVTAHV